MSAMDKLMWREACSAEVQYNIVTLGTETYMCPLDPIFSYDVLNLLTCVL